MRRTDWRRKDDSVFLRNQSSSRDCVRGTIVEGHETFSMKEKLIRNLPFVSDPSGRAQRQPGQ